VRPPALLAISPGLLGVDLRPWLTALGHAGLPAVLLREPWMSAVEVSSLVAFARDHVPLVVVHQRCAGARAQGCTLHLGAEHGLYDWSGAWGRSCHSVGECERATAQGASYTLLSPIWRPTSKPDDVRPTLGMESLMSAPAGTLALGGVTGARARLLRERGRPNAAVLGGLWRDGVPTAAAAACRHLLGELGA